MIVRKGWCGGVKPRTVDNWWGRDGGKEDRRQTWGGEGGGV